MNNLFSLDAKPVIHGPLTTPAEVPSDWLDLAFKITMAFEGTTWGTVAGNFDGMGVSAGVLQWNYGQGSLQSKILQPYINRYGSQKLDAFFGVNISQSAYLSGKEAVAWAKKNLLNSDGTLIRDRKTEWVKFMDRESVRHLQLVASNSIAARAFHDALDNGMDSKKAFCWFFDVYVQNGSLKGITKPELTFMEKVKTLFMNISGVEAETSIPGPVQADLSRYQTNLTIEAGHNMGFWLQKGADEETQILFNWICERAVKNQWRSDVISRKGTIAHGVGMVHGKFYDMKAVGAFGLSGAMGAPVGPS